MIRALSLLPLFALGACSDVEGDDHDHNENEVITTVRLSFRPVGGGDATIYVWADPENDGDPVIDPISLSDATDYVLEAAFLNELEDPAEDLTIEVADESDEHQVFLVGSGVEGPATGENPDAVVGVAYDDEDASGDPIGLVHSVETLGAGDGELTVVLRHLPPEDGAVVKGPGLAETVAEQGFAAIGGDDDVNVTFPISVE